MSRQTKYVLSNYYVKNIDEKNFSSGSFFSPFEDKVRYFSGNFWMLDNNELVKGLDQSDFSLFKIIKDPHREDVYILRANKLKFTSKKLNKKGIIEEKYDKKLWMDFIDNLIVDKNKIHEDHYFEFPYITNIAESENDAEPAINFINKEFVYNFDSKKFEILTSEKTFDSTTIPSIFSLISDDKIDRKTFIENLELSFGGLIPTAYAESLILAKQNSDAVQNYFDIYSEKYQTNDASFVLGPIKKLNTSIKILQSTLYSLRKLNFIPFPWFLTSKFSNLSREKDNFIHVLQDYPEVKPKIIDFIENNSTYMNSINFLENSEHSSNKPIKAKDLKAWLSDKLNSYVLQDNKNNTDYSIIEFTKFLQYLKDNIKPRLRNYHEIMDKTSEKHVLMYKIEKKLFSYDKTSVLQTFWIEPDEDQLLKFIDTQIKYGVEYYYTITAIVLSYGNSYSYDYYSYEGDESYQVRDIDDGQYRIKVKNSTSYKILEIPYAKFNGMIHEDPILKPVVRLEKDNNNIRFTLNEYTGRSLEHFNIVENGDFELFESIRLSQDNEEKEKIYSYESKYNKNILQIYRLTNYPINYLSFQGKIYKTIEIEKNKSFIDNVVPNIKYYYMFRYLNKHGIPSNTSDVYEVEMRNEDGFYYLIQNKIDVNKIQEKTLHKNFKRYLLVRPSAIQTQIRSNNLESTDLTMGPEKESVWNKNFLIRITSKKTNRVLEFTLKPRIDRQKK